MHNQRVDSDMCVKRLTDDIDEIAMLVFNETGKYLCKTEKGWELQENDDTYLYDDECNEIRTNMENRVKSPKELKDLFDGYA